MAPVKATRDRGRPDMQNTSPRRTRARSARARAASVSAAATTSAAATVSAPASTSTPALAPAPASADPAVVLMGAPPSECAIQEYFEYASGLQAVVRDAHETALPRSQWECEMERRGTPRGIF